MSSLGFPIENEDDFEKFGRMAVDLGEQQALGEKTYFRWRQSTGAELWVHAEGKDIVGLVPYFGGEPGMRAGLTARIVREDDSPLSGAFHAWANPSNDDSGDGDYPFVFDVPDFCLNSGLALPVTVRLCLSAFAHELNAYVSESAYAEANSDPNALRLASKSFIPMGLFNGGVESGPPATALFAGSVLATERRTNPVTHAGFDWIRVDTLGGPLDVVVDPSIVNGTVVEGGIISGSFWITGRIV